MVGCKIVYKNFIFRIDIDRNFIVDFIIIKLLFVDIFIMLVVWKNVCNLLIRLIKNVLELIIVIKF